MRADSLQMWTRGHRAEKVDESRIATRHGQGWVKEIAKTPEEAFGRAHDLMRKGEVRSIAFHFFALSIIIVLNAPIFCCKILHLKIGRAHV